MGASSFARFWVCWIGCSFISGLVAAGTPLRASMDRQSYELLGVSGQYSCNPAGLGGTDRSTLVCKISNVMVVNDKYTGSNAYGASRVVERTIGTDLAVALPNTPRIFGALKDSGTIFDYPDRDGSVNLVDSLQMPIASPGATGI